jgi:leucyl aminopeptidase (aminopeptidase T)
MRKPAAALAVALILATTLAAAPARAAGASAYDRVLADYETARLALADDSLASIAAAAQRLQSAAAELAAKPDAAAAAVGKDDLATVRALLPQVRQAAANLAAAKDLKPARDAFHALSQALIRWRQVADHGPDVATCPMVQRQWLQPARKQMGNPYAGRQMATCGQLVD